MAVKTSRLSDTEIKAAKAKDKDYVLSDGDGLQLRVRKNGSRLWNFNYRHPQSKKRINMGLGSYPDLSLVNARKKSMSARELVAQDIDPKAERNDKLLQDKATTEHTLLNVASEWFELKKDSVTADYAKDVWRSLEQYIFPSLAKTPISQITAPSVIALLRPIETKGSLETVKRLTQRLNEIMTYAVNGGIVFANPLSGIKANFKKPKKEHMLTLKPEELPELMLTFAHANIKRTTRCLFEWQLHTMTRPSEAAGASWKEIDFDNKTWTIPAERMKKKRIHVIPLTEQAMALLEMIKPLSGHREYIFPSDRDPKTHCNSQTVNMALKRMGFAGRLVSHGLRSLASTTLNEQGIDSDLIESALAHVDKNEVRRAYNRSEYLERRREVMNWWSEHIQQAAIGSLSVTGFKGVREMLTSLVRT
jgi:integrase